MYCIVTLSNGIGLVGHRIFTELGGNMLNSPKLPNKSTKWDRFATKKSHAALPLARKNNAGSFSPFSAPSSGSVSSPTSWSGWSPLSVILALCFSNYFLTLLNRFFSILTSRLHQFQSFISWAEFSSLLHLRKQLTLKFFLIYSCLIFSPKFFKFIFTNITYDFSIFFRYQPFSDFLVNSYPLIHLTIYSSMSVSHCCFRMFIVLVPV
jgi:hypothetical protein